MVVTALRSTEATAGGFTLAPRAAVLPAWSRRGQPGILDGTGGCYGSYGLPCCWANYLFMHRQATEAVIRCSPGEDSTNGFFISCFMRSCGACPTTRETQAGTAGSNNLPCTQSATVSAKRVHNKSSGEGTALTPPFGRGRGRKRRKLPYNRS